MIQKYIYLPLLINKNITFSIYTTQPSIFGIIEQITDSSNTGRNT